MPTSQYYSHEENRGRESYAKERKTAKELQRKRKINKRKLAPYGTRADKAQKL